MPSLWVFDLDGTLIDVEERYRRIHADLIAAAGGHPDKDYWARKREKTDESEIGLACGLSADAAGAYAAARLPLLENERYLACDSTFTGAIELLTDVGVGAALLATKRRDRAALDRQLDRLGLAGRFCAVLTPAAGAGKATLHGAIGELRRGRRVVSVTDSPQDIVDGKAAGFFTIAVLAGLRARRLIESAAPDLMIGSIGELSLKEIDHVTPI